jgi:putative SOS response-associated peptidase YedK
MCGRFTLTADPNELREAFPWLNFHHAPEARYNVAPTQPVAVVPNDGKNSLDYYTWGLIPFWAKDPSIGSRMINARSETLEEKPSFRSAFRRRRCLIPASGFYEWKAVEGQKSKTPMYIQLKTGKPFAFAGLWERWDSSDGSTIFSCTIITTQPNELVSKIHNRMPAILKPEDYHLWLDPGEPPIDHLHAMLQPFASDLMQAYEVSRMVNKPENDLPKLIEPVNTL